MDDYLFTLERDKEYICHKIHNSGRFEHILYSLYHSDGISLDIYKNFMDNSTPVLTQIRRLIHHLCNHRGNLIEIFLNALLKEALDDVVARINPQMTCCDPNHEFADKLVRLPHIPSSASCPQIPIIPHDSFPSNNSVSFPEGLNDRPAEPLQVRVRRSNTIFGLRESEEVYKNSSLPRGLVFIANYAQFQNGKYEERRGSPIDVKNICHLYSQMGYKVIDPYVNLTKEETLKALRNFRDNPELETVDSAIVIMMSHGVNDKSFSTFDMNISDAEVIELFNNHQCPHLKSKPKIFIFQYCRGSTSDLGVEQFPTPVSYERNADEELEVDSVAKGMTIPLTNLSTYSDMFIIYATYPGYVSFRNPVRGSWLIESICTEFMNNAYNNDLDSLMKMVSRRVRNLNSDKGRKQVIEHRSVGFDKHFYFNPISMDDASFDLHKLDEALAIPHNEMRHLLPFPLPHQRKPLHHELHSRASTPDMYELSHSSSGSRFNLSHSSSSNRLRHSSGISNASDEYEDKFRRRTDSNSSTNHLLPEAHSQWQPSSVAENVSYNLYEDVVDTPLHAMHIPPIPPSVQLGSSEHFKKYRMSKASSDEVRPDSPSHLKRQLSIPTDGEALHKAHGLQQYFYINGMDEMAKNIEGIKDQILKNKQKYKKRKKEKSPTSSSQ